MKKLAGLFGCYLMIAALVGPPVSAADGAEIIVSADQREQIRDLISKYSYALDNGREEEWLDLLTEDTWFETPVGNPRGTEALRRWFKERIASRHADVQVRHYALNTIIVPVSEGIVHARSMLLYTRQNIKEPLSAKVYATGVYEDEIHLMDKGWRLVSHKMGTVLPLDSKYFK
jgi:3-phenylpropionate/cinnamic acid dioxygenase small subunit